MREVEEVKRLAELIEQENKNREDGVYVDFCRKYDRINCYCNFFLVAIIFYENKTFYVSDLEQLTISEFGTAEELIEALFPA